MIRFADVSMHPWTMQETVAEIERRLDAGKFTQHVVINVAKAVNLQRDQTLRQAVENCDIVNIDGMGVVWGGRFLGFDIPERVAGIDLFHRLLELASRRGYPVYFLGATEEVVEKVAAKTPVDYPGLSIVGYHHGYFWQNEAEVVEQIKSSGARLLFVAISSPKKENFINRWREQLGVDFVMGVGGTFDVLVGKTKRAPLWMQRAGLEWVYRMLQEPGRLWYRYLDTNFRYALMLLKERFSKSPM